jgi:small redox-active disulfide protein 2
MTSSKDGIGYIGSKGIKIGIVGLPSLLEEAKTRNFATEEELARFLLDGVKARNYVPSSKEGEYSRLLLKEYKKFTGVLDDEDITEGILEIKILGPGCYSCQKVEQEILSVLAENNIPANVEHIKDLCEIVKYGVIGTPALVINNRVKSIGKVLTKEQVKKLISEEMQK